jgi:ABC-2 type transport system ATP-binding protein
MARGVYPSREAGTTSPVLELDNLFRRFGDTVALDGLTLTVPEGEVVGFVGPNGAGKTTAMRIALAVLQADSGEVRWRGAPVTRAAQRRFGYMPEERGLYPKMRVDWHLRYLATLHGRSDPDAVGAARRWIARLGLDENAERPVEELSLGNQQRVQLAAALVHDPDVLILDEPFSGLDPTGTDVMSEVLFERARDGVAAVFSSHQLELVERLCDRVAIVNEGRIVAAGTVEELRSERSRRLVRVDVEGVADRWYGDLTGFEVVARDRNGVVFEVADASDDQLLLEAARRAGRVRRFAPAEPSLAQLFREVVER